MSCELLRCIFFHRQRHFSCEQGSVINIKYVLLFSRRDGRGIPKSFISDTNLK
jgi:hypothetical protein